VFILLFVPTGESIHHSSASPAEQTMGRWVMGQWVKLVTLWMGHMGHGSVLVGP